MPHFQFLPGAFHTSLPAAVTYQSRLRIPDKFSENRTREMSNNGDGSKNVNGGGQPINTEKAPQEKTTETKVFDMLENVFSITLQGFFAGSIMGLCIENEPRKVENIEHISIGN